MQQAGHERLTCRIESYVGDERSVELHELRTQLEDVAQAGVAGPGIVDRPPHVCGDLRDRVAQSFVVVDRLALGDLQHDPAVAAMAGKQVLELQSLVDEGG